MASILNNFKIALALLTISVVFMVFVVVNKSSGSIRYFEDSIHQHSGTTKETNDTTNSFTEDLIHRAINIFHKPNFAFGAGEYFTICAPNKPRQPHELVLLTSMYHSNVKHPIFQTVIKMWSLLTPEVLPVLYITNMSFVTHSQDFLTQACSLGWVVAVTPKYLPSGFPLIDAMFRYSIRNFPAYWYGLSNGDMLYTDRLWRILKLLREKSYVSSQEPKISFVTSRKYGGLINSTDEISTIQDVHDRSKFAPLRAPNAIDLFIYRKDSVLLKNMPSFAMGRRGFDNWLVYQAVTNTETTPLDISKATPSLHLGIRGLTDKQNSHRSRSKDANYNVNIPVVRRSKNYYALGQINCIAHFVTIKNVTVDPEFAININKRQTPVRCQRGRRQHNIH